MNFWRIYYHVIWTTKNRAPLITPDNEPIIFEVIRAKSIELGGTLLTVNAIADHIHVAVTIPPKIAVSDWVQRAKGVSAYEINNKFPDALEPFRWQAGYGVLTFGAEDRESVVNYIQRQKEHHANNTLNPDLEQVE